MGPRGARTTLGVTMVGAALVVLPLPVEGLERFQLPKEWLLSLGALAAAVGWLRRPARLDAVDLWGLAFGAATLLSALASPAPETALRLAGLTAAALGLFLLARRAPALEAVVLAASAVAAVALLEALGVVAGLSGYGRAPGATLGQRNTVAHLCVLASPAAWHLAATATGRRRVMALVAGGLLAAAVVVTRSRAAWVTLPVGLLAWLVAGGSRRLVAAMVGVGVAAALLLPTRLAWKVERPYRDTFARLLDAEQGSGHGRLVQYRTSLRLLPEAPLLGVGPARWWVEYPRVAAPDDPGLHRHLREPLPRQLASDVVALPVERGLLGLALALAWLLGLVRAIGHGPTRAVGLATVAVALPVMVLDSVLGLASGACAAALLFGSVAPPAGEAPAPIAHRAAVAALALALGAAVVLATGRLAALVVRAEGSLASRERALRLAPDDLSTRLALAEALVGAADCARAAPHLAWLERQAPAWPAVRALHATCARR